MKWHQSLCLYTITHVKHLHAVHSKDMHHLLIFPIKTGIFLYRNNLPNLFDSFMTAPMASQSKQGMVDVSMLGLADQYD